MGACGLHPPAHLAGPRWQGQDEQAQDRGTGGTGVPGASPGFSRRGLPAGGAGQLYRPHRLELRRPYRAVHATGADRQVLVGGPQRLVGQL